MHAKAPKRIARKLTVLVSAALLTACGQGDGPVSIPNEPATPLPPLPPGFCDVINFEIFCEAPVIVNFNGGATTVIDNPDKSGLNETDKVAQMQKFPDDPALLFGGTKLELSDAIDFSQGESFSMLVWSPRSVRVVFKLEEQGNPGGGREIELTHTGSGSWEALCYDFTGQTGGIPTPVTAVTVIFDNGVRGAADTDPDNWTFFYDEITQVADCGGGGGPGPLDLPQDFENAVDSQFNNFDGGEVTIIDNPDVSGINLSARVAQMQKFDGAVFGGSTMPLASAIDFGNGEAFKVKVWSPRNVPMLFKLEGLNQELSLNHTGSSTWEELCYDFTGMTAGPAATGITFIFDLGQMGDAANDPANWTFFFDDVVQVADCAGGGPPAGGTPITPDNVVYATDPNVVVDLPPPVVENFGSGAVFDFAFAGDPDYNPALQITSGEGYGAGVHVGFVALTGYAAGFAASFENFVFKVKGDPANLTNFEVKFIEGTDTSVLYDLTTYAGSESLGNGWYQVSIPMTDFAANIAVNAGFLLGPAGGQGAPFTLLLTDIGFTGGGGGGGAGVTPEFVLYGTTAPADVPIPDFVQDVSGPQNFGSGATFDFAFADTTYDPVIAVTAGEGYGAGVWVAFIAVNGYANPIAAGYDTFNAKVKDSPLGTIEVKLIGAGDDSVFSADLATYAGSTDIGDGWYQLEIPFTDFTNPQNIPNHNGWLVGPPGDQGDAAFVFLLTDVGFSNAGGG